MLNNFVMGQTNLDLLIRELTSGEDRRAEAAAKGLAAHGSAALPRLEALLKSSDPDRRWWAVRALTEIPSPRVKKALIGALRDRNPSVRQCAALALRYQPHAGAIPDLVTALSDPDRLLARMAADALAAIGSQAVEPLIRVVEAGQRASRVEAVRALAEIGDTRAIPILFKTLDEDSALGEYWAGEGLERMGVGMSFFSP
jgi:HEAT repeat protein